MDTPRLVVLALTSISIFAAQGCEQRSQEQARDVAEDAARRAGKAAKGAARKAEAGLERGVDKAREGLAEARDRYEVDAKVEHTRERFAAAMDEAAAGFAAIAESGQAGGDALAGKVDRSSHMIAVAPAAVVCEGEASPRSCRIDPQLIEVLRESPMSLARDASLRPRKGETGAGLELVKVSAGGLTQAIGLREGDILLELNGVVLSSFEAIGALDEALAGQHLVKLVYERGGARERVEIMQQVPAPGGADPGAR